MNITVFRYMIRFPFSATILKEMDMQEGNMQERDIQERDIQEGNTYVSICPEADIICRGKTVEEAVENLKKEVEKFLGEELPEGFSKILFY